MTYWFVSDAGLAERLNGDGRGTAYAADLVYIVTGNICFAGVSMGVETV